MALAASADPATLILPWSLFLVHFFSLSFHASSKLCPDRCYSRTSYFRNWVLSLFVAWALVLVDVSRGRVFPSPRIAVGSCESSYSDQNSLSFHPALTLTELVRATQLCLGLLRTVVFLSSWVEYFRTFRSAPVHSSPPVQSWTVHQPFFCQVPGTPLGLGRAVFDLKTVGLSCVCVRDGQIGRVAYHSPGLVGDGLDLESAG